MRKLASVQRIDSMSPIEGKDRIALATVLGWHVIVQKDAFNVGDKCVYVEVDSVMPEKPEYEFLRPKKFIISTMKMAGTISQGICFPMSVLPDYETKDYPVGTDVTDIIGVKHRFDNIDDPVSDENNCPKWKHSRLMRYKWYRRLFMSRKKADANFPTFIHKTDETRIQSAPFYLNDKDGIYIATEKIDGTSGTFVLVKHKSLFRTRYEFIVCSRNRRLPKDDGSVYWDVAKKYDIENALKKLISKDFKWIAIQGECIGPRVQGNVYKVSEPDLYVFNIVTPNGRIGSTIASVLAKSVGMKFVPIVNQFYKLPNTVDEVISYAHGKSELCDTLREGLVIRSYDGKISFKAVDPEYLLKHKG